MHYSAVLRDIKDYVIWQLGYSVIKKFIKFQSEYFFNERTFLFRWPWMSQEFPSTIGHSNCTTK